VKYDKRNYSMPEDLGAATGEGKEKTHTHSMEDEISVAEFQPAECHGHPALDVRGEKDNRTFLDDHLEIGVQKLEDEVQICLRGEYVQQLEKKRETKARHSVSVKWRRLYARKRAPR
jgi:hypothetical protein